MKKKDRGMMRVLLSVLFISSCLVSHRVAAQADSADIEIVYKTSYPGHFAWLELRMKNPMPVSGMQFMITVSNPDLFNFHTDSVGVKNQVIRVDTCTWQPESLHVYHPECYKNTTVSSAVRFCRIDTAGSPINDFAQVACHGDLADTNLPACKWVEVVAIANSGNPLGVSLSYRKIFRLGLDVLCLPDSTTDRTVSFYMFPGGNSYLSDPQGNTIPFRYHQGELTVWWGRPGDANGDSLINAGDIIYLVSYLFRNGPHPCVPEAADANGSCRVDAGDVVYLVGYLFRGGPAPKPGCWHGKQDE
ncbi:MAG: dockerin type I repeat-containing protein [Candidatus Zixiibacteriota bacterium]